MNNGTTAPPDTFSLRVLAGRRWNVRALLGAVAAFVTAASAAANGLQHSSTILSRWATRLWCHGVAVFQPFCWPCAVEALCEQSPHPVPPCGMISGLRSARRFWSGLFLAYFAYWFLSLIRDRKSTDSLMNLHGSATRAKRIITH